MTVPQNLRRKCPAESPTPLYSQFRYYIHNKLLSVRLIDKLDFGKCHPRRYPDMESQNQEITKPYAREQNFPKLGAGGSQKELKKRRV